MKAKLSYSVINTDLKQSFVVMIDDVFYRNRTRVEKDTTHVELSCIEDIHNISNNYPHTVYACIQVPIEVAKENVVKFIATYKSNDKDIEMSISHESSSNVLDLLESSGRDSVTNSTAYDKLRNKEDIVIEGKVGFIHTLPRVNEICIVTEIGIIDRYKLYNPADRQATIVQVDKYNVQLELINSKQLVNCKREHFKILKLDKFYLFTLYCPYCKR